MLRYANIASQQVRRSSNHNTATGYRNVVVDSSHVGPRGDRMPRVVLFLMRPSHARQLEERVEDYYCMPGLAAKIVHIQHNALSTHNEGMYMKECTYIQFVQHYCSLTTAQNLSYRCPPSVLPLMPCCNVQYVLDCTNIRST